MNRATPSAQRRASSGVVGTFCIDASASLAALWRSRVVQTSGMSRAAHAPEASPRSKQRSASRQAKRTAPSPLLSRSGPASIASTIASSGVGEQRSKAAGAARRSAALAPPGSSSRSLASARTRHAQPRASSSTGWARDWEGLVGGAGSGASEGRSASGPCAETESEWAPSSRSSRRRVAAQSPDHPSISAASSSSRSSPPNRSSPSSSTDRASDGQPTEWATRASSASPRGSSRRARRIRFSHGSSGWSVRSSSPAFCRRSPWSGGNRVDSAKTMGRAGSAQNGGGLSRPSRSARHPDGLCCSPAANSRARRPLGDASRVEGLGTSSEKTSRRPSGPAWRENSRYPSRPPVWTKTRRLSVERARRATRSGFVLGSRTRCPGSPSLLTGSTPMTVSGAPSLPTSMSSGSSSSGSGKASTSRM